MNLTKHGIFRYLQRIKKDERFLTEEQFNSFSKKNLEEYEKLRTEAEKEIKKENLLFLGNFKIKDNKACDYFLDKEKRAIFLSESGNIITCLTLNYVDDKESDDLIFEGYFKSLNKLIEEIYKIEEEKKEEDFKLDIQIKEIELDIKKFKLLINELEEKKRKINQKLISLSENLNLKKESLKITIEKMIRL